MVVNTELAEYFLSFFEKYDHSGKYKINADNLIANATEECYREMMVSYYPMIPLLEHTVPMEEADYILYMHFYARCDDFSDLVQKEIRYIAQNRKAGAEIIVVGKAANAEKQLKGEIDNIAFLGDHFTEKLGKKFGYDIREQYFVYDEYAKWLAIWPVDGCLSKCKFCRRCYMDIKFESLSLEEIKANLDRIKVEHPEWLKTISLRAENLTQYGIDLYGKPMLHKLLELLESYDVKDIEFPIGLELAMIEDEVLDFLCYSQKISFLAINVEAGTDRLLKVIGKGHTCDHAREVFGRIKKENPKASISTNVIVGFPTETVGDMVETGKFLVELKPDYIAVKPFVFSPNTPLAEYPQLTDKCREYHISILQKYLLKHRDLLKGTQLEGVYTYKYPLSKKDSNRKLDFAETNTMYKKIGWTSIYPPYDVVL